MSEKEPKITGSIKKWIRNPIFLGLIIGFLAAMTQALFFSVGGPEAYGFCVACHTRDLVNDAINSIFGTNLGIAPISENSLLPTLSILGVVFGAFLSAKLNKEFKFKKGNISIYLWYFFGGIFIIFFALFIGGCPYRNALRFAYGDLIALIGILATAVGVFIGVKILLYKMNKKMEEDG